MHTQAPHAVTATGLVGFETTGVADRSIAMDILHALVEATGMYRAFSYDMAFDPPARIWRAIETTLDLDLLLVVLRPGAAVLLDRLDQALAIRHASGHAPPLVVFGGTTAHVAHGRISAAPAMVWAGEAEAGWPRVLDRLGRHAPHLRAAMRDVSPARFATPAQDSTARSIHAGGTVWVEASRSCPLECSFCVLSTPELNARWAPRPVDQLLDEIQHITTTYGVTDFSFSDYSAFETDAYVTEFLHGIRERDLHCTFRCDLRLATARRLRGKLPKLHAAGLRAVYVGIESLIQRQRTVYGKGYPGKSIIELLRSYGIFVAAGFITLDPMYTPEEFRQQVRGITEHDLLDSIATPFKTMRIQRNTTYEHQARDMGIIGSLNPDGYTYSYRCSDPRMEVIREVIEFFHATTKDIYYNPYIENNIRERHDVNDAHRQALARVTRRYKEAQIRFLEDLAEIATAHDNVTMVTSLVYQAADKFSSTRAAIFRQTASDYEILLDQGIRHYRQDLIAFINQYRTIREFVPEAH